MRNTLRALFTFRRAYATAPRTYMTPSAFASVSSSKTFDASAALRIDRLRRWWQNLRFWVGGDPRQHQRQRVVVLGTGWAAMNFLMNLDVTKYEVSIVSPRNYFTFTPLLPSVCAGTLSPRSCLEPVRNKMLRGGKKVMEFYEGWGATLDTNKKILTCVTKSGKQFDLSYDYLTICVGAEPNTFGIPGVIDHSKFLKEVENAREIHKTVLDHFEEAILPTCSEQERRKLLHFVVVGGGPTGVETAAELADFVHDDAARHYPQLMPYVQITLVEMLDKVLPMFTQKVSQFTIDNLKSHRIEPLLQCRVTKLSEEEITLVDVSGKQRTVPHGFVLWASGVGQVGFVKQLLSSIPEQKTNRALRVNERLHLIGCSPDVYALGDCSLLTPGPLAIHLEELYEAASKSPTGAGPTWLKANLKRLGAAFPQLASTPPDFAALGADHLSKSEFENLLSDIDKGYKPPAPTAQNATQEGRYLAAIFNRHVSRESKLKAPAYIYRWKGQMAYVGGGQSVVDSPLGTFLGGIHTNLFWKTFYWSQQMSFTNKWICAFDWMRSVLRGRDVGRDHTKQFLPVPPPLREKTGGSC